MVKKTLPNFNARAVHGLRQFLFPVFTPRGPLTLSGPLDRVPIITASSDVGRES